VTLSGQTYPGGLGGGGTGLDNQGVAGSGTTNTGGGGGGAEGGGGTSGAGGSGIVIIAYPDSFAALSSISGGLTYTQPATRSGYRVYRFTAGTGPISW
jgi:hypothetical protein